MLKIHINQNINLLINKKEGTELNHLNDSKAFVECFYEMGDVYRNIEECDSEKKRKILIVFDDMNVDMLSNKKLNTFVTELFIRDTKLNISLVFITQFYFTVPQKILDQVLQTIYYEKFKQTRTSTSHI